MIDVLTAWSAVSFSRKFQVIELIVLKACGERQRLTLPTDAAPVAFSLYLAQISQWIYSIPHVFGMGTCLPCLGCKYSFCVILNRSLRLSYAHSQCGVFEGFCANVNLAVMRSSKAVVPKHLYKILRTEQGCVCVCLLGWGGGC